MHNAFASALVAPDRKVRLARSLRCAALGWPRTRAAIAPSPLPLKWPTLALTPPFLLSLCVSPSVQTHVASVGKLLVGVARENQAKAAKK